MKIMQVIPSLCMGGAEIMCETLSRALTNSGNAVTVVSLFSGETPIGRRLKEDGIPIIFLYKKSGIDLSMIGKLKQTILQEKPDVIHCHLGAFKYTAIAAKKAKYRGKLVYTVHSLAEKDGSDVDRYLCKKWFVKGKAVPVALSEAVKKTVENVYGLPSSRIPIVFNGVDLSKCRMKSTYEKADPFVWIHVGRFTDVKNHQGLISAFSDFHKKYENSELWCIGDGEEKANMEAYAKELQLQSAIRFLGLQSDVFPFLQQADAYILSSKYEGIPMTLIEAMGSGLPIVATRVGGIPDMLEDSVSGLLVDVTPSAMTKAMESLYESTDLRKKLGTAAYKISARFSAIEMAEQYMKIYNTCKTNCISEKEQQ